jgi:SAM-dependent methyltransferase
MTAVAEGHRHIPLRVRLYAWWQGYDPNDIYHGDPVALDFERSGKPRAELRDPRSLTVPLWSGERVGVVERLWGESMHTPGGEEHLLTLLSPFGLNPTMTVLEFGAGLGGVARTMCKQFGCWVTGIEQSQLLAEIGMERSRAAGLDKKAPIEHFEPKKLQLKTSGYNCIFAKEAFFTWSDKPALFAAMIDALRPGGQIGFTDYVLPEMTRPTPKVEEWIADEPETPQPWSSQLMVDALSHAGLEVRIAEDVTDLHQKTILKSWRELTQSLVPGSIPAETVPYLVREAELWARRGALLRSGEIRVYRFHAVKAAEAAL